MKVYISSDMEGSTGVVSPEQVRFGCAEYEFGRRMQLHDALAAAKAALKCGADSVVVNDSHDRMINLDISQFPDGVEIVSGTPKILGMVEGVSGCDVAFFIGYHAMAGTEKAILDHTYNSRVVYDLKVNGVKLGETGLNALFCGALGVPVGLVSGDLAVCLEAKSLLGPDLDTCDVKEGVGRIAAVCQPAETTSATIAESVKKAVEKAAGGKCPSFWLEGPYKMELTFHTAAQTDAAGLVPGSERTAGRTLVFNTEDVYELRRWFFSAMETAAAVPF